MSSAEVIAVLESVEFDAVVAFGVLMFAFAVLRWFVDGFRAAFRAN